MNNPYYDDGQVSCTWEMRARCCPRSASRRTASSRIRRTSPRAWAGTAGPTAGWTWPPACRGRCGASCRCGSSPSRHIAASNSGGRGGGCPRNRGRARRLGEAQRQVPAPTASSASTRSPATGTAATGSRLPRGTDNARRHRQDSTPQRRRPHRAEHGESQLRQPGGGPRLHAVHDPGSLDARPGHGTRRRSPAACMEPMIEYACPPGGLVVDMFAGSCSTLVTARPDRPPGYRVRVA